MTVNFALIGCNDVAEAYAISIEATADAQLVAVTEHHPERRATFATAHRCEPFDTPRHVFACPDVHAVCLCTTPEMSARLAIQAAIAGKHIITGAPIALHMIDADALVNIVHKAGVKMVVAAPYRYSAAALALKHALTKPGIVTGHVSILACTPQLFISPLTEAIDILLWLFARHVVRVFAMRTGVMAAEDSLSGVLQFADGSLAAVECSKAASPHTAHRGVSVTTAAGTIALEGPALGEITRGHFVDPVSSQTSGTFEDVIADMMEAIFTDTAPQANGLDARPSLRLALAMQRSAETGAPVLLS